MSYDASRPAFVPHSRRAFLRFVTAAGLASRVHSGSARAQAIAPAFSYPLGLPDRALGDGLLVRHGYAIENTWYNPGWLHTGEDWYLRDGETGGVGVYAAAAGEIAFAGSEYPGLVVIIAHDDGLYSMYGHLDYALGVEPGQTVARGQLLGTVLTRDDGRAPSHLHFEMRQFFTTAAVNGDSPRHGVACGFECPPGPGYWPIDAPELPSALGWRNPTHVINRRAWGENVPVGVEMIVSDAAPASTPLWTAPADTAGAEPRGALPLIAGERYPLLAVDAGAEDATGTSAEAYRLWYRIALPDGGEGWVQAAVPDASDTGSDGRPSSVRFDFLPAVVTPEV
ncbi:MAG: M23 family metallopeptidase [Chloroflexia bacterium]|nr:M23 family metallopeptidase [Chloroflexia bacterium]